MGASHRVAGTRNRRYAPIKVILCPYQSMTAISYVTMTNALNVVAFFHFRC